MYDIRLVSRSLVDVITSEATQSLHFAPTNMGELRPAVLGLAGNGHGDMPLQTSKRNVHRLIGNCDLLSLSVGVRQAGRNQQC